MSREPRDSPSDDGESRQGRADEVREPLADLTERINRRRQRGEADAQFEDAFETVEVGEMDTDAVWDQLSSETAEPAVDPESDGDDRHPTRETREIRVIKKRTYCQGCEHFATPPEVGCTHEGTEILELVDSDHFRVADCPIIAEAERLAGERSPGDSERKK